MKLFTEENSNDRTQNGLTYIGKDTEEKRFRRTKPKRQRQEKDLHGVFHLSQSHHCVFERGTKESSGLHHFYMNNVKVICMKSQLTSHVLFLIGQTTDKNQ